MSVENYAFYKGTHQNVSVKYQLFLPHDYKSKTENDYPLILFLHGVKKRGEDGNGTWDFTSRSSEIFSAAVPISGWFDSEKAMLLKDVPIWAFHCVDDDIVPVSGTKDMVKALISIAGNVKFTYYSGLKHDHRVMHETFNNAELYTWLLNQKRKI